MAEPNFGTILSPIAIDNENSTVDFTQCPATPGIGYLAITDPIKQNTWYWQAASYLMAAIDNEGEREFVIVRKDMYGVWTFRIYTVDTSGTNPVFTLSTATTFIPADIDTDDYGSLTWFGIQKISSALYYIYYGRSLTTDGHFYRFNRLEIIPGVSYTNTISAEIDPTHTVGWDYSMFANAGVIGRKAYMAYEKGYSASYGGELVGHQVFIYSADMDDGGYVDGGMIYDSGGNGSTMRKPYLQDITPFQMGTVAFMETNGEFHWATVTAEYVLSGDWRTLTLYLVVDGVEHGQFCETFKQSIVWQWSIGSLNQTAPSGSFQFNGREFQYNSRDWLVYSFASYVHYIGEPPYGYWESGAVYLKYNSDDDFAVFDDGTWDQPYPVGGYHGPFRSTSRFPSIVWNSSSDTFYWADPSTGIEDDTVLSTLSGVAEIYHIFPTLDHQDGSIYMYVRLTAGNAHRLIGVDPDTHDITRTIDISINTTDGWWFSHGNFLMSYGQAYYIKNMSVVEGANTVLMMLEQN
jgi:hypothetical protein